MAMNLQKGDDKKSSINLSKGGDTSGTESPKPSVNLSKGGTVPAGETKKPSFNFNKEPLPEKGKKETHASGEKKKGNVLIWVLLAIIAGAAVLFFMRSGNTDNTTAGAESGDASSDTVAMGETPTSAASSTNGEQTAVQQNPSGEVAGDNAVSGDASSGTTAGNIQPTASTSTGTSTTSTPVAKAKASPPNVSNISLAGFSNGSSMLNDLANGKIDEIVNYMNSNSAVSITVFGHASSDGDPSLNFRLSEARARALKSLLVDKGISASRIQVVGKGSDQPVADNASEEGRAKNRRVEVSFQ